MYKFYGLQLIVYLIFPLLLPPLSVILMLSFFVVADPDFDSQTFQNFNASSPAPVASIVPSGDKPECNTLAS